MIKLKSKYYTIPSTTLNHQARNEKKQTVNSKKANLAKIAKCKKPSKKRGSPLDEALYNTIRPKLKSKKKVKSKCYSKLQKSKRSEKRDLVPPWMRLYITPY